MIINDKKHIASHNFYHGFDVNLEIEENQQVCKTEGQYILVKTKENKLGIIQEETNNKNKKIYSN